MKKEYPDSDRRPKSYVCKNCKHIVVSIELPEWLHPEEVDAGERLKATIKATIVTEDNQFYCALMPMWKQMDDETKHYCGQFKLRENWQKGYQDIERIWEEVDRVYATRYDCKPVPEKVRQAA